MYQSHAEKGPALTLVLGPQLLLLQLHNYSCFYTVWIYGRTFASNKSVDQEEGSVKCVKTESTIPELIAGVL